MAGWVAEGSSVRREALGEAVGAQHPQRAAGAGVGVGVGEGEGAAGFQERVLEPEEEALGGSFHFLVTGIKR